MKFPKLIALVLWLLMLTTAVGALKDPYKVLGVSRHATKQEIKKSYRNLVKIYHPDKNKAPDAAQKFEDIREAMELLVDDEKREMYDQYGTVETHRGFEYETPGFSNELNYHQLFRIIISRQSEEFYMIFVCPHPSEINPYSHRQKYWETISADMNEQGFNVGWVNSRNYHMKHKLNLQRHVEEAVVLVYRGNIAVMKYEISIDWSFMDWHKFAVKNILTWCQNCVKRLDSQHWMNDEYLTDMKLDKPKVVYRAKKYDEIPAWFAVFAAQNSQYQDFAIAGEDSLLNFKTFDGALVFTDGLTKPTYRIRRKTRTIAEMRSSIEEHRYNTMPRIHSPQRLEQLCPRDAHEICVILAINSRKEGAKDFEKEIVNFVRSWEYSKIEYIPVNIRLMSVDSYKQKDFVASFVDDVAVLENHYMIFAKRKIYGGFHSTNITLDEADDFGRYFMRGYTKAYQDIFQKRDIKLAHVVDEHGLDPILNWLIGALEFIRQPSDARDTFLSLGLPLLLLVAYARSRLNSGSSSTKETKKKYEKPEKNSYTPTYFGHPEFKPSRLKNYQTSKLDVVLLTDMKEKNILQDFTSVMKTYLRDSKIFASVMDWRKHEAWCELLINATDQEDLLDDVPEETSDEMNGTVIVICSLKKWCCVYRPPKNLPINGGLSNRASLSAFIDRVREGQKTRHYFDSWDFL